MELLKCEVCNSTDLIKQDGVFKCQTCGAKYSIEEIRSLFSKTGNVAEEAAEAQKQATLSDYRAKEKIARINESWDKAIELCKLITDLAPNETEYVLYCEYSKVRKVMLSSDFEAKRLAVADFEKAISNIQPNYDDAKTPTAQRLYKQLCTDVIELKTKNCTYSGLFDKDGNIIESDKEKTFELFDSLCLTYCKVLDGILAAIPEEIKTDKALYAQLSHRLAKTVAEGTGTQKQTAEALIPGYENILLATDATFKAQKENLAKQEQLRQDSEKRRQLLQQKKNNRITALQNLANSKLNKIFSLVSMILSIVLCPITFFAIFTLEELSGFPAVIVCFLPIAFSAAGLILSITLYKEPCCIAPCLANSIISFVAYVVTAGIFGGTIMFEPVFPSFILLAIVLFVSVHYISTFLYVFRKIKFPKYY